MNVNKDLAMVISAMAFGAGLITYGHANFASKSTVEKLDDRVYQIWTETVPAEKRKNIDPQEK